MQWYGLGLARAREQVDRAITAALAADSHRNRLLSLALGGGAAGATLLFALYLTRPLRRMTGFAERVAAGQEADLELPPYLGKDEIGCVSTGNVGTAVAPYAAKAGVTAYVVYPNRLEDTKARACAALGAKVCQVEGNYDEANRCCREVAHATGMEFANITLRPFYAEGAKTSAFEIVEQLNWRAPDHIVTAAAGGTLSSRLHKGLRELAQLELADTEPTRIHIAQPSGCNPIASAILAEEAEIQAVTPETAAHSLAIGAPGDGYLVIDAVRKRGGTGGFASDPEIFTGIDLLASTEGMLTEPAGGTTIAVLEKLAAAGRFGPNDTVVAIITGNGLKTLDDHPEKPWPAKIDCELDAMLAALEELRRGGSPSASARERLPA